MKFLVLLFVVFNQPLFANPQSLGLFEWVPDGRRPRELPETCSSQELEKIVIENTVPSVRSAKLLNYFSRCQMYHTLLGESGYYALWNLFNIEYDYEKVPSIKPVLLKMRDGAILHAVLAMKPDSHPRPLVIAQCGLTCTTEGSASIRWPLMHLYDASPFHVLVIGSSTTSEFGIANKKFFAGGLQEGLYINEVAKWVRSQESGLNPFVSSIHVQGMSLGGHGALYSAVYAQDNNDDKLISSTQAYSPVVELKPAVDNIMSNSKPAQFLQLKIWQQMEQMIGRVPIIDKMIPNGKRPSPERTKEIVAQASLEYYGSNNVMTSILKLLIRVFNFPTTIDDFWQSNRFSTLVQNLRSPALIWSADDDPAVRPSENSLILLEYANKPGSSLTVLNTSTGSHCGFALSHGWDVYTKLMTSFILAYSPEFQKDYKYKSRSLAKVQGDEIVLLPGQRHFSQAFRIDEGSDTLQVSYIVFDPHQKKCANQDPFLMEDAERCFDIQTTRIKIEDLGESLLYTPRNRAEAQMLTRWANANLTIVDHEGRRLVNSTQVPVSISWREVAR